MRTVQPCTNALPYSKERKPRSSQKNWRFSGSSCRHWSASPNNCSPWPGTIAHSAELMRPVDDACDHLLRWQHAFGCVKPYRFVRHSPDHAACFILGNGATTCLANRQQTARAIVAHAGQEHTHGALA